jgi:hypothetical protein
MSGIEKHNSCIGVRGLYVTYFKAHHGKQICSVLHVLLRGRQYSWTANFSTTIKYGPLANDQVTQKAEPAQNDLSFSRPFRIEMGKTLRPTVYVA